LNSRRLNREKKTIEAMMGIYCQAHHHSQGKLCQECGELLHYAFARIEKCPHGDQKPACAKCRIHCYNKAMRDRVRQVMRFSGPRMMLRHPLLTALHYLDQVTKGEGVAAGRSRASDGV